MHACPSPSALPFRLSFFRVFVIHFVTAILACLAVPLAGFDRACAEYVQGEVAYVQADVAVVGATPGGIAAAVSAARQGEGVVLVEYEDHIGGIVSNGLTNSDIANQRAVAGLFYEFTRRVLRYYQGPDGTTANSPNVKLCHNGYWFEADVAERIYHDLIAGEGSRIQMLLRHELKRAIVADGRLVSIVLEARGRPGQPIQLRARAFIDATYEGDLAALAKAPYRVGREGRQEYGEPHAGRVYAPFGRNELLPGSTGEADRAIQGFCFRFHVTKDPSKRVAVAKPQGYCRDDYRHLLADMKSGRLVKLGQAIQVYPMPNGKFELNSNHPDPVTGVPSESFDLAEENWDWPEAGPAERRRMYERYLSHNVGLLWFLQNDPEVPEAIRRDAQQYGWCRDLWPANGHLPRQVYVRQGRRILGEYVLTELDGRLDPETQRTRLQPTSVGIVEYAFDYHGARKYDPAHPGVREGYIYIRHEPLQVPYGVLVPRQVDGLLVPVACSASHVAYNALRMEPVFMALGQAAGIAAHLAIRDNVPVRRVAVPMLQHLLVAQGGVITHYNDLPFDHPAFAAFQWLGARGLNHGYMATPGLKLTRSAAWERLARVLRAEGKQWTQPTDRPDAPLRGRDLADWLTQAGFKRDAHEFRDLYDRELDLTQFVTLVYRAFAPASH